MEVTENFVQSPGRAQSASERKPDWFSLALDAGQICAYKHNLKTNTVVRSHQPANSSFLFNPKNNQWTWEEALANVHPEDRNYVTDRLNTCKKSKEVVTYDCRVLNSAGEILWIRINSQATFDDQGRPVEILSVTQDITDQKRNEEELERKSAELEVTNSRLQLALASANMAALARVSGSVEPFKSPELSKLLDLENPDSEFTRDTLFERVHPEDRADFLKIREDAFDGRKIDSEIRFIRPNGDMKYLSFKGTTLKDSRSDLLHNYLIIQDVTKGRESEGLLKKKNAEIAAINARLEQFSSVAAHDLKGPLTSIAMMADLLKKKFKDVEEVRGYADFIRRGVDRMSNLITDLLEFAKFDKNAKLTRENVSLDEVLETVITNLQAALLRSGGIINYPHPLPVVSGQRFQLIQLFQNLISNALKFCKSRPPQIEIGVIEAGERWLVSVQDNGVGIEPAHINRVFEPFERLRSNEFEGTGLGLSICQRIVRLHGGEIWIDSVLGEGSKFSFTLPKSL